MAIRNVQSDQEHLRRMWSAAKVIADDAVWTAMDGGRSNPIWRVDLADGPSLVCKLYDPSSATPLFANDGNREALALQTLEGVSIAPRFVAFRTSAIGESLVYRHIEGNTWQGDLKEIAVLMAQLHQLQPPAALPSLSSAPKSLIVNAQRMLKETESGLPAPPSAPDLPAPRHAFLHGDIVPGNILVTPKGVRLIDWQCPAIGDPSLDLAVFLSPAMQVAYGRRPLSAEEVSTFLATYADASHDCLTVDRYRALAPLFHWRMAAYCQWKVAHGDDAYAQGIGLELAALDRLEQR